MNAESNPPAEIKRELEAAIAETIAYSERERREENSAFSRKSELTKERMIKLLLSMNGGNLEKELYKAGVSAATNFAVWNLRTFWSVSTKVKGISRRTKGIGC